MVLSMPLMFEHSSVSIAEWTLGAVLYEDELAAISECLSSETTASSGHTTVSTAHWSLY